MGSGTYLVVVCSTVTVFLSPLFQDTKLWIIMEYLGGGSALDLVSHSCFRSLLVDLTEFMLLLSHIFNFN